MSFTTEYPSNRIVGNIMRDNQDANYLWAIPHPRPLPKKGGERYANKHLW
jgi:hypothetical protein